MESMSPDLAVVFALTSGIACLMLVMAREHRLLDKVARTRRCAACGVVLPRVGSCRCSR